MNRDIKRKLAQYFKDKLGMWDYRRGWMKGTCPMCNADKKYGVHLEDNKTHCFKCEYIDRPIEVVLKLENFSTFNEAWAYIKAFEGADYLETPVQYLPEKNAILPEGFSLINLGDGLYGRYARRYMKSRGFDILELALRGIGYCRRGRHKGRIIIPYYESGKLIYYNSRLFIASGKKFDNPTIEELGVGKTMVLYNVDALSIYEDIFLVESATDSLTLGEDCIAAGGKVLSTYQITKILKSPIHSITIILDPDAWYEAILLAMKFVNYKRVRLVKLPEKVYSRSLKKPIKADVNQIGRKSTLKYINRSKWVSHQDLIRYKIEYERAQLTY